MNFIERMLDTAPAAIIACDRDGRILHVNYRWIEIFAPGKQLRNVVGTMPDEYMPEAVCKRLRRRDDEVWRTGEARDVDMTVLLPDGVRVFLAHKFPIYDDNNGMMIAVGTTATDITERRRQQARVASQRERSDRLEAIGELSAGVAHDFNNLLAIIDMYGAFARQDRQDFDKFDGDMNQIQAAVKSGTELVESLLTFSRREPGEREQLKVRDVANDMAEMFKRLLHSNIKIRTIYDDGGSWIVIADRSQLERTFVNLVVNARDAMPDGGRLTISIEKVIENGLRLVKIEFADTGEGMTERVKAKAFEPFFTTKPKGKGSGLGLATVYGVVRGIGGRIDVESEVGKGTTFTLMLPAFDPEEIEALRQGMEDAN